MSYESREWLYLVAESAFGQPMTGPTLNTNSAYIRLVDGNAFGMVAAPVHEQIMWGGGYAIPAEEISDHYACRGPLRTKLFPTQASFLLNWALTRVNTAQTSPWVTTEPPGDLASCSLVHAVMRSDGTYRYTQFAGVKPASVRIEVSRGSTTAMLTMDLQGGQAYAEAFDATSPPTIGTYAPGPPLVLPAPVDTNYPLGPYTFHMTSGQLSIASTRSQYESLAIAVTNALDGRWFEGTFVSINRFCGRSSTLNAALLLKATPDDRTAYEAITAQSCSVGFMNGVTGQNLTISMNGQNRITALPYDLPINQVYMNNLTLQNLYDPTAGGDLSLSFS
jgi:hypothetical protein